MNIYLVPLTTFAVAAGGTWLVRQYARSHNVLDVPNERSSHTLPTPRGGGAAIVLAMLLAILVLWSGQMLDTAAALAAVGAGSAVAVVGFIDDHRPLPARVRLAVHFGAAAWALYWTGLPQVWYVTLGSALPAAIGYPVTAVALVWLLNLYNFMDGIDGLAASEAVFVCAAASLILLTDGGGAPPMAMVLAAAALGFLLWNLPPASIFMGDVGSGFVGIMLGIIGLVEFEQSLANGAAWLILLAVFITDATVTLFRRWRSGVSVSTAHRTHAYQRLSRRFGSHRPVTLLVALVNLFWLLPLALLVQRGILGAAAGLAAAFLPLAAAAWLLGAGVQPTES